MDRSERTETAIVGGGLVGSLLSLFLARRGREVTVYERRPDVRTTRGPGGRSINLVLTTRGIRALREVGLDRGALELTVPVAGRMLHAADGALAYQPYGRDPSECNHSVPRAALNDFLVREAEARGVRFEFDCRLAQADLDGGRLVFHDARGDRRFTVRPESAFGADGAGSAVREAMTRLIGFEERVEMLEHGYKELEIAADGSGGFRLEPGALHIWPRGELMLMALPNRDGSFTVTLYLPHRGPHGFDRLETPARVRHLFETRFADALPLIDDLEGSFFRNPTGSLGTVRCRPWHHGGEAQLIGDAAHAIVPFFGQGMNCGFEDCTVLGELLDARTVGGSREALFAEFTRRRKPDADAIADMALENFVEMRDRVGDPAFLLRKQVEHRLEREMPARYRSRYSMVMYSHIPYRTAQEAGRLQEAILDRLCRGLESPEALDLDRARRLIAERLTPFLGERGVTLDY